MPYWYRDDIAIADIAFEAWGETCEELFIASADATLNVMVENTENVLESERFTFDMSAESLETLLFNFLGELIFYKDSRQLLLRVSHLTITSHNSNHSLSADVYGEPIDPNRHHMSVDIKAVTLYQLRVEKTHDGWEATVVLDV